MIADASTAKQAQPDRRGAAVRLIEGIKQAFRPAKNRAVGSTVEVKEPHRAGNIRWIEIDGRRVGVSGPTSDRNAGLGEAVLWRRGNRPRMGRPFDREKVTADFEIEVVLPWEEPGEYGVVLETTGGSRRQCYRILLGGNSRVRPIDLGIALPAGRAMVRPFFIPETGEVRINFASQFEVVEGPPMLDPAQGIALVKSDSYESARARFDDNLERLDYESNWRLRQQEIDEGRTVMTAAPRSIQLQIGHVCNIDCIMCNTGRNPDQTPMPEAVLRDLPRLLKFVDRVAIQGGEPLMYKSLRDHIAAAADHPRVVVSLGTNGMLLERGGWVDVVTRGRFMLWISLDAATPGTYERIRRKSSWTDVIGGIDAVNEKRNGRWPSVGFSFCVMRSNYKEIVDFVDLAYSRRASSIYYNLMEPGDLEAENKNENLHEDPETLREVVQALRDAYVRANELGIRISDKVLGWVFPKYPHLMTRPDDVKLVPTDIAASHGRIAEYAAADEIFWQRRGGPPAAKPLPAALPALASNIDLGRLKPLPPHRYRQDGFFCNYPFELFNIDVENTFLCCHAYPPFDRMTFGRIEGSFDVWNHPYMQFSRRAMLGNTAKDTVCHPRCPFYRTNGYRPAA